jgi:predicted oxidoreductase
VNPDAKGFTAVLGAGYYYGSCGGLDVDIDMQVLDTNKQKIPGLYAAGQDSMGVLFHHKKPYVGYGAAAQGWSITSGRLAAAAAMAAQ